jgi:hypothetical protein
MASNAQCNRKLPLVPPVPVLRTFALHISILEAQYNSKVEVNPNSWGSPLSISSEIVPQSNLLDHDPIDTYTVRLEQSMR